MESSTPMAPRKSCQPIGIRSCYDEGKRFAEAAVLATARLPPELEHPVRRERDAVVAFARRAGLGRYDAADAGDAAVQVFDPVDGTRRLRRCHEHESRKAQHRHEGHELAPSNTSRPVAPSDTAPWSKIKTN